MKGDRTKREYSHPVLSPQHQPHPRTEETALKHASQRWLRPLSDHSLLAFQQVLRWKKEVNGPLWLDVGCGTGKGTASLAKRHPQCLVIGIDKSQVRLSAHQSESHRGSYKLIRANLEDFWRLCFEHEMEFDGQTFFYPNPWPKPEHRMRRWPQHPVFPYALACGGVWELRTNWLIYAQEFALAIKALTGVEPSISSWHPKDDETLFERKYRLSGHSLWRMTVPIPSRWRPAFV